MIKLTTALTLGILLVLVTGSAGHAGSPPLPASFYGTATLDGAGVAEGTLVSAWINGVKYAEAATTLADGTSVYLLDVPGDDPDTPDSEGGRDGESVVFQIAGFDATPTTLWFSGSHDELNLQVITGPDLVVTQVGLENMTTDPQTLAAGGTLTATIANHGNIDAPSTATFAVTFFEDRNGNGRYDPAADNTLGRATHATGLDAGAEVEVVATVAGQVLFRDNLVYALVDSGDAVAELSESNNVGHSGTRCEVHPPVGQFNPVLEWHWPDERSATPGYAGEVDMAPAVADITADGIPDIIFVSNYYIDYGGPPGYLHAVSGRDGTDIPLPGTAGQYVEGAGTAAVGDIDHDDRPEIVATKDGYVYVYEHDGTFKWKSTQHWRPYLWSPAIADIDRDGTPEIVAGGMVLNSDGTLRWQASQGDALGVNGVVANLDLQGDPEIIVGNAAYRSDGSLYWNVRDQLSQGVYYISGNTAVGNFDDDPFPEVVIDAWTLDSAEVYLVEHDGTLKWGPVAIPLVDCSPSCRTRSVGAPAVGDVDNDGQPEIGLASSYYYVLLETDGSIKWTYPIAETSSGFTGSTMFDFEGDGSTEIVYSDEQKLFIFRGSDGTVLFETPMGNATAAEYPVVADVDADGSAEIVVASTIHINDPGIYVFGDANDTWVPTRQIWNQYAYHVGNVNDDASIPAEEPNSWQVHNTYRAQWQPDPFRAPDLTASWLRFDFSAMPDPMLVTARIGNGGALQVGPGAPAAFYDGDPAAGGTLLGVAHTLETLQPGEYEDVTFSWTNPPAGVHDVYVVANPVGVQGAVSECDRDNNTHHQAVDLGGLRPDLTVLAIDPSAAATDPQSLTIAGDVAVQIENQGNQDVTEPFQVTLFEDLDGDAAYTAGVDNVLGQTTHTGTLAVGASTGLPVPVSGQVLFRDNLIYAFADSEDAIAELAENNNLNHSGMACEYRPPQGEINPILAWEWISSTIETASDQVLMTPVVVDLTADGTPDIVFITSDSTSSYDGVLRAIDGQDGSELFSVTDQNTRLHTSSHIAVGDIDLDGRPEILAQHEPTGTGGGTIDAFEHDGTFKWRSQPATGSPAIADIDRDGVPEIVVGDTVLNNDGSLRWIGGYGRGERLDSSGVSWGAVSLVANLDLVGDPEIVAGNTAYRSDGSLYWHRDDLTDGWNAIGDFDGGGAPEVVLVTAPSEFTPGQVYLLEHDGATRWGPLALPNFAYNYDNGGPPTIADVDADGQTEIIVAASRELYVIEGDGAIKWASPIEGYTVGIQASTAYDFDGAGAAEVVFVDSEKVRIYRGSDGTVLWETPGSAVNLTVPVVADVDADGHAELVLGATDLWTSGGSHGIQVYGDDTWWPTWPVWNQYTYHVNNIHVDATIPVDEVLSWQDHNSYRCNVPTVPRSPDLTVSWLRFDLATPPRVLHITARIGNGGSLYAGIGLPVTFYDGDPAAGGALLGTVNTTQLLEPGEYEDVTFTWLGPPPGTHEIYVVADDDPSAGSGQGGAGAGTQHECDTTNNVHHRAVEVAGPDLVVPVVDASGTTTDPQALTIAGDVLVQIENQGDQDASTPFAVTLFEDSDGDGAFTPGVDNVLGQRSYYGTLAIGQSVQLPVAVSGNTLFRDNLIYAFADSLNTIIELDENNNVNQTGASCQYLPPEGPFQAVVEWQWTGGTTEQYSHQVAMTPVIVDLTGEGIPDIIFTTFRDDRYLGESQLRAISGEDGHEIFTRISTGVPYDYYDVRAGGSLAVGDIDMDGRPEILAVEGAGDSIIATEHDGHFKWLSPSLGYDIKWGGAAIADLDQDGTPEIVVGATVLNNDGTVRWTGAGGRGDNGEGPLSLVANLDQEGNPEIVAGNTAYYADGSIYWQNTGLTDGLNAVANFDDDPYPEVVLVTQGKVYLLEHDGMVKWGPAFLPGDPADNLGGPPTVADLDGDGKPEIGVASGAAYTVFEADGSVKWSSATDGGAGTTAGTAFDFEGDGQVEIVYADAHKLRIYRGRDGTVLWETASRSGTTYDTYQMPVVADVDADGHAEIVMGSNNLIGTDIDFPGPRGIQVYGDATDRWVPTRPIWNQHTYHVTNVDDDSTVPQVETDNWQIYNNYRANIQTGELPIIGAPDLTASYIRVDLGNYPTSVAFTARVGNGGATDVPAGLRVAFYNGDPSAVGTPLGSTTTSHTLAPGEYEDVTFVWTSPGSGLQTIYVVADHDNAYNECNEANNIHQYQYITGPAGPDLTVPLLDGSGASTDPRTLTIDGMVSAQITNQGSTAATGDFDVTFFEDLDGDGAYTPGTDNLLGQTTYSGSLAPGAAISASAAISGEVRFVGSALWAFADSGDAIPELDETNNLNQTATQCQVNAAPAPDLTLSHLMAEPADLSTGAGERRGRGAEGQGSKGAEEQRSGGAEGQGSRGVDLTVRVANAGEAPVAPGVPANFYLGDPAAGGTLLGDTATSRTLAPGDFEDVTIRWTNETTGTHTIFVTVDAAGECDEANSTYQQRVDILDIPLAESWNLISGWVNPFYTDVDTVQRPISGTYAVIQGFDGGARSYYPDLPAAVNTLKTMDAEHGYWIKTVNSDQLSVNSNQLQELRGKGDRHFLKPVGGPATLVLRPEQARQTQCRSAGHLISLSPRKSCQLSVVSDESSPITDDCSPITDNCSLITDNWPLVATLRIIGTGWAEDRELALDAGWNLVSFLSRNEMGVMEGLRSIEGEYRAALGFDQGALSYYPHLEPYFNTLWALQPLHGYWLKMTQGSTLRYPRTQPDTVGVAQLAGADPDARRRAQLARQAERATGIQATNTWVNFYGPARLSDGKPAPAGALVQVFDAEGVPCGAGVVTEPGLYGLLACYGDDPTTPADEGASPGDVLTFTIDGQPAAVSAKAVWTAHGALQRVPLGAVRLWKVRLPVVEIGD